MKDAGGRYLLVNHQWENIFGHTQEEVRGKTSHDIFTPEDAEISWDYDRTVLASGAAIEIEEIAPHEDGPHVYLSTKFPLCGEDGNPYAVCGMATDITERKRTELEIRKLSLAVEQSPSLVVITDPEGRIEYVNPRFTQVTGFDSGEVEGMDVLDLGEQAPEEKEEMRRIISSGGEWHGEFLNRTKSSGVYWEEATVTPLKDDEGRITHLLKVAEDVTERKRSEERLKKTLADLERSNKELEQFAYVASHDLQEPLRVVTSYMNLLERRYQEQLDADGHKFIAYAVDASRRMKNLIEDLLAYSRVETRAGSFEPTDFDSVLDEALANLEAAINESGAVIRREPLPTLLADGSQLTQLFQNLVGNAVKFRGEEAPEVRISAALEEDAWHFSVSDNGIGIEPRHTDRIFEIFKRLHTREEYAGTGIGLAICKKIVERHGGRIWVESSAGEGATFNFTIPIVGGPNP
jgi:PAS domain S-box-containing protein